MLCLERLVFISHSPESLSFQNCPILDTASFNKGQSRAIELVWTEHFEPRWAPTTSSKMSFCFVCLGEQQTSRCESLKYFTKLASD